MHVKNDKKGKQKHRIEVKKKRPYEDSIYYVLDLSSGP